MMVRSLGSLPIPAPEAQPEPPAPLAPYALLRVAALSYDVPRGLAPPRTTALLGQMIAARADAEKVRAAVEDALFTAVPRLINKNVQRAAVRLKRDVHNGRATEPPEGAAEAIAAALAPDAAAALRDWLAAQRRIREARADLIDTFSAELRGHVRPRLRAVLADDDFRRAMALASPELQAAWTREADRTPMVVHANKPEKALLSYLIRAAVKTSPFSTFMHVVPLAIDERGPGEVDFARLVPARRAHLNRGMWARLADAAAAALVDDPILEANPTLRDLGRGRLEAITGRAEALLGRPWSSVRVLRYRFHPAISALLLGGGSRPASEWQDRLCAAGLPAAGARELIQKLVQRGLLWPPAVVDVFDDDPGASVCARFAAASEFGVTVARDAVHQLDARSRAFVDAGPEERSAALGDLRQIELTALTALGLTEVDKLTNVVLEDSWRCGATGALGGGLLVRLRELADFLSTQVGVSPEYVTLTRLFVQQFGEGGRCTDLMGFVRAAIHHLIEPLELGQRPRLPSPPRAPAGARLGVTVQVQVAAQGSGALAAGDLRLVVNRAHEGVGWLATRFIGRGHPDHEALASRLQSWLVEAAAPREPLDLIVSGHCNDLQTHPRLTRRIFGWEGEPIRPERRDVVRPAELTLLHDPDGGRLELVDRDGTLVAPCSLGGAVPNSSWGIPWVLHLLGQPYQILRPDWVQASLTADSPAVVFEPRRTYKSVVLTRACHWVRAAWVRERWLAKSGAERLVAVAEDVHALRLPTVFFAGRRIEPLDVKVVTQQSIDSGYKPLWVDTRNPFCLDLLERVARQGEWISLTEVLPGEPELWVELNGHRHVSELQVEMVVTARDGTHEVS
jgi:hypothetical protein